MQKTITLFTGENQYTITQEITRRYTSFLAKYPEASLHYYTPLNRNIEEIEQQIFWGGLFSSHKIIILNGIPLDSTPWNTLKVEEIEDIANDILNRSIPDGVVLILVSYKPDKRTKFFKAFPQENIKNFPLLDEREIKQFIKEKSDSLSLKFWNSEIDAFFNFIGGDQFRIESELNKLAWYKDFHPDFHFTPENMENFLFLTPEVNNFEFFDVLLESPEKAEKYLEHMQEEWSNWVMAMGFFHWGIKNDLLLIDAYEKGIKDQKILASELKMHPFVLKKTLTKIKSLLEKKSYIINFLQGLIRIESGIKKGMIWEDYFRLEIKKLLFANEKVK